MQTEVEVSGDIVGRQELLDGTQILTLEGASDDGMWSIACLLTWNIGVASNTGEGDITLSRADGAELFGTLVSGDVREAPESDEADHMFRLEYQVDGGTGAFESACGTATGQGALSGGAFHGRWTVDLDP